MAEELERVICEGMSVNKYVEGPTESNEMQSNTEKN
jgi:hypothetical protein